MQANTSTTPISIQPTSDADLQTAMEGLNRIQTGAKTGEWQPFLEMLTEDVTFYAPVPGFADQGLLCGKDKAAQLFGHHHSVTRTEWTIKQILTNGNEIGFEARIEGTIEGYEYSNQVVMVFVIEDSKIAHFREYAAYMSPEGRGWTKADVARGAFDYLNR